MEEHSKEYELIQEELKDLIYSKKGGLRERIYDSMYRLFIANRAIKYSFLVPSSDYLRAELLCEDISIESGYIFTHTDLLNLLFRDFLINMRRIPDHHKIHSELAARDQRPPLICKNGQEQKVHNSKEYIKIEFVVNRRDALRVEVFLADVNELYPDTPFMVPDVIQILYCDFIKAYRTGGMKDVVNRIISHLEEE
ncbi:hypothetical protein IIE26_26845 (plasmid) [Cytobacillus oceanisediminis]|uniref:hypothetical protein n=1 Tax=Cytobacillus oceanisediminis TaxID=665099 RepID=UPI0018644488|nr:hypothetical protein [Cytobacillus oceanisediminis]QOK29988.1 hypothetical protein IIE26_26845 [Cytobacillus oceanisediminis]